MNQTNQTETNFEVNQKVGMTWTNNNRTYKAVVKIVKVNGSSTRIELESCLPSDYKDEKGRQWSISNKFTKGNNLFINYSEEEITKFNDGEQKTNEMVTKLVDKYWTEREITKAEVHKKEGVYKAGETYVFKGNGLEKVKDN